MAWRIRAALRISVENKADEDHRLAASMERTFLARDKRVLNSLDLIGMDSLFTGKSQSTTVLALVSEIFRVLVVHANLYGH
jgi:hypothetical protein